MVNLKRLTDRAKDVVEKRGGTDALKADAEELRGIAKGKGSLKDKAKAAAAAMKDPSRKGGERGAAGGPAPGHKEAGPSSAPKQDRSPEHPGPTRSK